MSNTHRLFRAFCLGLGMATAWFVVGLTGMAQEPQPAAVLSLASVDTLLDDFAYLARLAGRSEVSGFVELAAAGFLQEIDRTRPLGVLITIRDDEPQGVGFLAVRDLDKLLQLARDKFAVEVDSLDNGICKLEIGQGVYLRQHAGWLFFSDHPRRLINPPDDPVALCGGLDQQYSVALRVFVQHIPSGLRDLAAFQLHAQIEREIQAKPAEDPELDRPFLDSVARGLKQSVSTFLAQCDQLTVGWGVDADQQRVHVDLSATAMPGSELAEAITGLDLASRTLDGAVTPDAAMTFHVGMQLPRQARQAIQTVVAYVRAKALHHLAQDAAPQALSDIFASVFDVADRTVADAAIETAASAVVASHSFRFIAGARVADGQALATSMQKLYELARQQPGVPTAEFFAAKSGDLDLHHLKIAISRHDADARKVFGPELEIVLGTGPQHLHVALGRQSEELLRSAVDPATARGGKPSDHNSLLAFHLAARPLLAFLAGLEGDQKKPRRMAEILAAARGGDGVGLTVSSIPQGLHCRLEVEEGVLEMLAKTASPQDGSR